MEKNQNVEKVAKDFAKKYRGPKVIRNVIDGFIAGTDWQKERSYTEEEVAALIKKCWNTAFQYGVNENFCHSDLADCNSCKEWFELNKKKLI